MKSVLISIQPKWCEKIYNGEKTIEVRKSAPKEVPFKCYIYCTIGKGIKGDYLIPSNLQCGKVIGEFVCDKVSTYIPLGLRGFEEVSDNLAKMCLSKAELDNYGGLKTLYGWHISDLKIYDKPKELSEFQKPCKMTLPMCDRCEYYSSWNGRCENITHPPQSWCYVEKA